MRKKSYSNSFINKIHNTIITYRMIEPGNSILIGVSGGPDSMALLYSLLSLKELYGLNLAIAHINHGLRDIEATKDADFVKNLAKKHHVPFFLKNANVYEYSKANKLSLEQAGRSVRYQFFQELAQNLGCDKIAVGHTKDDNVELFLMFLLRGSGPLGLAGIPPVRAEQIIRPLIEVNRKEIYTYLMEKDICFVEDKSNQDPIFLRNKIRNNLIPHLEKEYNPQIVSAISHTITIVRDEYDWISSQIDAAYKKILIHRLKDSVALDLKQFSDLHVSVQRRILRKSIQEILGNTKKIMFFHIEDMRKLIQRPKKKGELHLPNRIRIGKDNQILKIERMSSSLRSLKKEKSQKESFTHIIKGPGHFIFTQFKISLNFEISAGFDLSVFKNLTRNEALFDAKTIGFPLEIRNVSPKDRFFPLGMSQSVCVKNYIKNKKIDRQHRQNWPVLVANNRIIWVIGLSINETVKVTAGTKKHLRAKIMLA